MISWWAGIAGMHDQLAGAASAWASNIMNRYMIARLRTSNRVIAPGETFRRKADS